MANDGDFIDFLLGGIFSAIGWVISAIFSLIGSIFSGISILR